MKYLVLFEKFESFDRHDIINKIWNWYSQSAFDTPWDDKEELSFLSDDELNTIYQDMLDEFQNTDDMTVGCGCCSKCTGESDCNCCSECTCDDVDLPHDIHFGLLDERAKAQRYKGRKIPGKYLTKNPGKMKKEIDTYIGKKEYKKDWDADYESGKGGVGKRVKTKKSAATKAYQRMFGGKEK